jgi:hypothetical protein
LPVLSEKSRENRWATDPITPTDTFEVFATALMAANNGTWDFEGRIQWQCYDGTHIEAATFICNFILVE